MPRFDARRDRTNARTSNWDYLLHPPTASCAREIVVRAAINAERGATSAESCLGDKARLKIVGKVDQ